MSTTTTYLGATAIIQGQSVMDNATVTGTNGNHTPTGMVSFQVSYDSGPWTTFSANVTLVNGTAVSTMYMPADEGNYSFQAMYMGDSFFNTSTSAAGSEMLKVSVRTGPGIPDDNSTTTTWLGASNITLGQSVTDNATVMAGEGNDLNGSITFMVSHNGGPWTPFDVNVTLVNGSAVSGSFTPSSTGTYWFKANYSGNNDIFPSSSANNSEMLNVTAVVPPVGNSTTTTSLGVSSIMLGQSVTDNATVSAAPGSNLSGTVTFMVSYNGGPWMMGTAVPLVNGSAVSALYTPALAGMYEFKANYSGNAKLHPSSSANGTERLNVTAITPIGNSTTTTRLGATSIRLGQSVTDNATITAAPGSNLSGTVTFWVSYNGGPGMIFDANVTVVNGSAASGLFIPNLTGTYWFKAEYSGNANLHPSSSANGTEMLNVTSVVPPVGNSTTTTSLGASDIHLGQSVTDNATISAAPGSNLSGSVTFWVSYNGGPGMIFDANVTVMNGKAVSVVFTPSLTGTYWFKAEYSGNANLHPSSSANGTERLNVSAVVPPVGNSTTMTWLGAYSIQLGQSVTDNATIMAAPGSNLSGTVTFMVSYNGGPWIPYDADVAVMNGMAVSAFYMPPVAGTYAFKANYSGNANLHPSSSMDGAEMLNVTPIVPPVCRCISVGEAVRDNATVTGLAGFQAPTGTVDFQVSYMNGTWMTFDPNVPLVNGSAMSKWYFPLAAGNYNFRAMYNGDSNYLPSLSGDTLEPLCVVQAQRMDTTTTTMLSASNISLGHSVLDRATVMGVLLGSPAPTGMVDFQVSFNGGNWTTFDPMVSLTNGSATSASYVPLAAGHYAFRAIYSGDTMFNGSMSGDRDELLLVAPGPTGGQNGSGVVTLLSHSDIRLGMSVTDMVTVFGIGGDFPVPTGTVTFQVSFMNGTWMTLDANVPLVNGSAMSSTFMPMAAGNYTFRAVYSGDANYLGATSGADNESLIVEKARSTTVTNLGVCMPMA